jgi:hypothetical protein
VRGLLAGIVLITVSSHGVAIKDGWANLQACDLAAQWIQATQLASAHCFVMGAEKTR